ncbi:hypothetical protein [Sphingosinicella sp. BN140058]|uniref:hypothetical protein n=1 Tax=Sphingosinicella sp. BN140058 TaxID=1892855 RepID=UPI001010913A|nr:hypothetical protein [Sphingosinicella sp. BN140058]QAY80177.1 hypothetical protein ETR14_26400 [Sphingosinicella sp. BN140058]
MNPTDPSNTSPPEPIAQIDPDQGSSASATGESAVQGSEQTPEAETTYRTIDPTPTTPDKVDPSWSIALRPGEEPVVEFGPGVAIDSPLNRNDRQTAAVIAAGTDVASSASDPKGAVAAACAEASKFVGDAEANPNKTRYTEPAEKLAKRIAKLKKNQLPKNSLAKNLAGQQHSKNEVVEGVPVLLEFFKGMWQSVRTQREARRRRVDELEAQELKDAAKTMKELEAEAAKAASENAAQRATDKAGAPEKDGPETPGGDGGEGPAAGGSEPTVAAEPAPTHVDSGETVGERMGREIQEAINGRHADPDWKAPEASMLPSEFLEGATKDDLLAASLGRPEMMQNEANRALIEETRSIADQRYMIAIDPQQQPEAPAVTEQTTPVPARASAEPAEQTAQIVPPASIVTAQPSQKAEIQATAAPILPDQAKSVAPVQAKAPPAAASTGKATIAPAQPSANEPAKSADALGGSGLGMAVTAVNPVAGVGLAAAQMHGAQKAAGQTHTQMKAASDATKATPKGFQAAAVKPAPATSPGPNRRVLMLSPTSKEGSKQHAALVVTLPPKQQRTGAIHEQASRLPRPARPVLSVGPKTSGGVSRVHGLGTEIRKFIGEERAQAARSAPSRDHDRTARFVKIRGDSSGRSR